MRRRARVDKHSTVHCRKCGSENLMMRSGQPGEKLRRLKCADCDERQWLHTRHLHKLLDTRPTADDAAVPLDTQTQLIFGDPELGGAN